MDSHITDRGRRPILTYPRRWLGTQWPQLSRYALVGFGSNLAGYACYLGLTFVGAPPKLAMTVVYVLAATLAFWGNRQLTFAHKGRVAPAGARFIAAQAGGYAIDFALLTLGVDVLGFPHAAVQAIAVGVVAMYLYLLLSLWVFSQGRERA